MDNARDAIQKFAKSKKGRKAEEELKRPSHKAPVRARTKETGQPKSQVSLRATALKEGIIVIELF